MANKMQPSVSMGHVVLHTSDMKASVSFYECLGLCGVQSPTVPPDELMLMEMRGGTDLLIVHRDSGLIADFPVSSVGYSGYTAPVDIMIGEHERKDLERYRDRIKGDGLNPEAISDEKHLGIGISESMIRTDTQSQFLRPIQTSIKRSQRFCLVMPSCDCNHGQNGIDTLSR